MSNTGDIAVSGISVGDQVTLGSGSVVTFTGVLTSLAPGASDYSDVIDTTAAAGQNTDKATVTGSASDGTNTTTVTANNPARGARSNGEQCGEKR